MKLKQLKLHELNKKELTKRQMNQTIGGNKPNGCACGCNYAGSGGSSTHDNANANWNAGYTQSGGGNNLCALYADQAWVANTW